MLKTTNSSNTYFKLDISQSVGKRQLDLRTRFIRFIACVNSIRFIVEWACVHNKTVHRYSDCPSSEPVDWCASGAFVCLRRDAIEKELVTFRSKASLCTQYGMRTAFRCVQEVYVLVMITITVALNRKQMKAAHFDYPKK